jgi:hypothetical protein
MESLQYLEALCKDLGRPYDEWSKKLDKLRRSMPVQQQAATTRAAAAPTAPSQQRSERPTKPERTDRPGVAPVTQVERSMRDLAGSNRSDNGPSPLKAPTLRSSNVPANAPQRKVCARIISCFNLIRAVSLCELLTIVYICRPPRLLTMRTTLLTRTWEVC